jgi:MFS family permease
MAPALLGPDHGHRMTWGGVRSSWLGTWRGLVAALGHLRDRPVAAGGLAITVVVRFGYGLMLMMTVLMCRTLLVAPGEADAGFTLLSLVFLATGTGFVLSAPLTPAAVRRWSARRWIVMMLVLLAAGDLVLVAGVGVETLLVVAVLAGLATQGSKICVDALVQQEVDDDFRGRVFSLYDVLFNAAFVLAAGVGALVLPVTGYSRWVLVLLTTGFIISAVVYRRGDAMHRQGGPVSAADTG